MNAATSKEKHTKALEIIVAKLCSSAATNPIARKFKPKHMLLFKNGHLLKDGALIQAEHALMNKTCLSTYVYNVPFGYLCHLNKSMCNVNLLKSSSFKLTIFIEKSTLTYLLDCPVLKP